MSKKVNTTKDETFVIVFFCITGLFVATLTYLMYGIKETTKKVPQIEEKVYHFEKPTDLNDEILRGNKREELDLLIEMK